MTFLTIFTAAVGAVAAFWFLGEFLIALSCRADDGRVVFAHVRELLRASAEWSEERGPFSRRLTTWRGPEAIGVTVEEGELSEYISAIDLAGRKLVPGFGWRRRIKSSLNRMIADKAKAERLNAICDVMEDMERRRSA